MSQPVDEVEVLVVPDFSDFARELKAGIDNALRGVQAEVAAAFGRIEDAAARAGHEVGAEFQQGGERAESAFREVSRTARTEFAEVNAAATSSGLVISSRLGEALAFVKTALIGLSVATVAGLGAMTGFGLKSAASLEQSQVAFTSLLGSADQAKTFLTELQAFAAATPFEFQDVVGASQRLLVLTKALGQTKDAVVPLLTTIGDLVSVTGGTSENIDSVVRALSQMASKGKISQEEMMQLAEALPGFNANAAIASALGLSTADALAKITAGGVDATTGINALIKGMQQFPGAAGAMIAQSQTLTGVFSTFKDTIGIALTSGFAPVIPEIKNSLAALTPVLGDAIGKLAPSLGGLLSGLLPLIGDLVKGITPILTPLLDALGPALKDLGPQLVPLGEALGELMVSLVPLIPLFTEFITVLIQLAIPAIRYMAGVLGVATPALDFMTRSIAELSKALGMIDWGDTLKAISDAFTTAFNWVLDVLKKAETGWMDFDQTIATALIGFRDNVFNKIEEVIGFIVGLPGRIIAALEGFGALLYDKGRDLIQGMINGIGSMGSALWNYVTGFVDRYITQPIKDKLHIGSPSKLMADEVGRQIPAGVAMGVEAGGPGLASVMANMVPTPSAAGAGAPGTAFGGITINLVFGGGVPNEGEARRAGSAAADALMARIVQQRTIALAGRSA